MYCNYCGKVIPDDANLCSYCGKRVAGVVARKRLVRPRNGRKVAGVCLGFSEYFDLDVTLVRICVGSLLGLWIIRRGCLLRGMVRDAGGATAALFASAGAYTG